jgi:5-formyltetrahydrofolate cyclo-ligase
MSSEAAEAKRLLRLRMAETGRSLSPADLARDSAALCQRMREQAVWRQAGSVFLFHPLAGEADVRPLLVESLASGRTVVLPRFNSSMLEYEGVETQSLEDLKPGHFGILEPGLKCPTFPLNRLDLTLVPGVAFDRLGRRLGRGKGYYDRLLARVGGTTCGVAFDWQLVPEVPAQPHDIGVNSILTPSRWLRCVEARGGL